MVTTKVVHEADAIDAFGLVADFLIILSFISTLTVCLLVRSYLNSVSLSKECLLLYLYKEVATAIAWMRFVWVVEVVLANWNVFEARQLEATIISFIMWFGFFYLVVIFIIISFLKLYMNKTGQVDPPMPMWVGENEKSAIIRVRFFCCLLVVGFLSVCFGFGLYPKLYYTILKDTTIHPDLFTSNLFYRGTATLLLLIFVITSLVVKYHKTTNEPQIDSIILWVVNFLAGVFLLTIGLLTLSEFLQILNVETRWKCYQVSMSTIQIIIQPAAVLKSKQLRFHSARVLKTKYDDLLMLRIYFAPAALSILIYSSLYTLYQFIDV